MRATTVLGAALLALSTAALAQIATDPVENKTNTVPTGNNTADPATNSDNASDTVANPTGNSADQPPLGIVPGDATATSGAPPK